jgi:hypothetical protein
MVSEHLGKLSRKPQPALEAARPYAKLRSFICVSGGLGKDWAIFLFHVSPFTDEEIDAQTK